MADDIQYLMLEHLKQLRKDMAELRLDVMDMKARVSALEQVQGQILVLLGGLNQRMDRFDERLGRVERRLDLADA